MNNSVKISIIIPVYNVEDYLSRCLDSILRQNFLDFEVIIINDASTDNSESIILEYQNNDNRIKYFLQKKNQGQGFARNLGINQSVGEYILFLDSDDFICEDVNLLDFIYNEIKKDDLDILELDHIRYYSDSKKIKHSVNNSNSIFDGEYFFGNISNSIVVWDKLWKRDFLINKELSFRQNKYEDLDFTIKAFLLAKKVKHKNIFLYNYCIRENSTMTSKIVEQNIIDILELSKELERLYIKSENEFILKYLSGSLMNSIRYNKETFRNDNIKYDFYKNIIFKCYNRSKFDILKCKRINFFLRMSLFFSLSLSTYIYFNFMKLRNK